MNLQGAMTAMVTPFGTDGQVDFDRLRKNVHFQIKHGIDALVPVGTTGESPTLSHEEHRQVIECVVEAVRSGQRRVPVIAGAGSNATSEAMSLTKYAHSVGCDAVLSVVPYYNKPTQEGQYRHFMTIADAVDIPVILYNIPGRCGAGLTAGTIARLAKHPNIVGVKEATGVLDMASEIALLCDPKKFIILSGDDSLTLPIMSVGGRGVISVLGNLLPQKVKALTQAVMDMDMTKARKLHLELFNLCRVMFIETNPIPIKTSMAMAGMDSGELRLPMCAMSQSNRAVLETALRSAKLIK